MCSHDAFTVLLYIKGLIIRKCKHCGEVEIKLEDWISIDVASRILGFELVQGLADKYPEVAKEFADPK